MPSILPKRTGLKTIKAFLERVCRLIAKWRPLWLTFMSEEQVAQMDALVEVCNDVVALITDLVG